MNIICNKYTNLIVFYTETPILNSGATFTSGGINTGYSVVDNVVYDNAPTADNFYYNCYTYTPETGYVCVNQELLDSNIYFAKETFNAEQKKKRFAAYTVESDPIFFKSQRGEATNQEWLDAIAAIDARFPYQE